MQRPYARITILVLIALALLANAACAGGSAPQVPGRTEAPAESATTAPSQAEATATSGIPTAEASPTAEQPAPTTAPAEEPSPTVEASPTAEQPLPTTEQPAGQGEILVLLDQQILAGVGLDGAVRPFDVPNLDKQTFQITGSRDGAWLAGPTDEMWQSVTIYNVKTGEPRVFANHGGTVGSFIFSPDSTRLLFLVKNMNTGAWQLKAIELASGEDTVVLESAGEPAYQPLAWTARGVLVTEVYVLAADAAPSALHVLDPETGRLETILPEGDPYIMAEASRDGGKLAIVKGQQGLGMENPTPSLVIVDLETGETTEVEGAAPGFIYDLRWAPGGARLIYARAKADGSPATYTIVGTAGGQPMLVDLSAAPGTVKDVAWDTDDTLLVLLAEGGEENLYHLPATSTDASALRELASIDSPTEDRGSAILSVGR